MQYELHEIIAYNKYKYQQRLIQWKKTNTIH